MKNSTISLFLAFIFITLIMSCQGNTVKVKIIGSKNPTSDTLIFDSNDTIIMNSSLDSIFLASNRRHTFTINNSKPTSFFVNGKEGILNIYKNEFVVFNVDYKKEGSLGNRTGFGEIELSYFVLIDSFLVGKKKFETELKDIKTFNEIIDTISVKKNGNYKSIINERFRIVEGDYDSSNEMLTGFKKIGKDNLFIEKFWNYDINERIPEELSVQVRDEDKEYDQSLTKSAIVLANDFLANAKIWTSEFIVIDVRDDLRKRKK